jgi:hypothetical protein
VEGINKGKPKVTKKTNKVAEEWLPDALQSGLRGQSLLEEAKKENELLKALVSRRKGLGKDWTALDEANNRFLQTAENVGEKGPRSLGAASTRIKELPRSAEPLMKGYQGFQEWHKGMLSRMQNTPDTWWTEQRAFFTNPETGGSMEKWRVSALEKLGLVEKGPKGLRLTEKGKAWRSE